MSFSKRHRVYPFCFFQSLETVPTGSAETLSPGMEAASARKLMHELETGEMRFTIVRGDQLYLRTRAALKKNFPGLTDAQTHKLTAVLIGNLFRLKAKIYPRFDPNRIEIGDEVFYRFENSKVVFEYHSPLSNQRGMVEFSLEPEQMAIIQQESQHRLDQLRAEFGPIEIQPEDQPFVKRIETVIWRNIRALDQRNPQSPDAALIAFDQALEGLTPEQFAWVRRLLQIDPGTLGLKELVYTPTITSDHFVTDPLIGNGEIPVTSAARDALNQAILDFQNDCGNEIDESLLVHAGYRSEGYQLAIFLSALTANGYDLQKAMQLVELPGYSTHQNPEQLGIDFKGSKSRKEEFEQTQCYAWLVQNGWKYGLFQTDSEQPWHWEFVSENNTSLSAAATASDSISEDLSERMRENWDGRLTRFMVRHSPLDLAMQRTKETREELASRYAKALLDAMEDNHIPINFDTIAICLAQIEREGDFLEDPLIPDASAMYRRYRQKALREIKEKLYEIGFGAALLMPLCEAAITRYEAKYRARIVVCKTEHELELVLREIAQELRQDPEIQSWMRKPVIGRQLQSAFEDGLRLIEDPIQRAGMMQVDVDKAYALSQARGETVTREEVRARLYTAEWNMQYGLALLKDPIQTYLSQRRGSVELVFADYNAGAFASRNAAFQAVLNTLGQSVGISLPPLSLDGDLLAYDEQGRAKDIETKTLAKAAAVANELSLGLNPEQIRLDFGQEKTPDFENTQTYLSFVQAYQRRFREPPRYARMPEIRMPTAEKFGAEITTANYVTASNARYERIIYQLLS